VYEDFYSTVFTSVRKKHDALFTEERKKYYQYELTTWRTFTRKKI